MLAEGQWSGNWQASFSEMPLQPTQARDMTTLLLGFSPASEHVNAGGMVDAPQSRAAEAASLPQAAEIRLFWIGQPVAESGNEFG
jgi:hypothetical protein